MEGKKKVFKPYELIRYLTLIINSRFLLEVSPEMAMKNTIMLLCWVVLRRRNQCHHQQFIIMFCKPTFSSSAAHPFRSSANQPTTKHDKQVDQRTHPGAYIDM
jgi:hypothetical protein